MLLMTEEYILYKGSRRAQQQRHILVDFSNFLRNDNKFVFRLNIVKILVHISKDVFLESLEILDGSGAQNALSLNCGKNELCTSLGICDRVQRRVSYESPAILSAWRIGPTKEKPENLQKSGLSRAVSAKNQSDRTEEFRDYLHVPKGIGSKAREAQSINFRHYKSYNNFMS